MIKMIITDCDGVLTDGKLYYGAEGEVLKVFNVKDGSAIKSIMAQGIIFGVMSGRASKALERRASELSLNFCLMGVENKEVAVRELKQDFKLLREEVLFVGDDVNDSVVREECGHLFAVADAVSQLKDVADHVLETPGGAGVFKEISQKLHGYQ